MGSSPKIRVRTRTGTINPLNNFLEISQINWCELENFWKRSSSRYIFAQRGDTPRPADSAPRNLPQISISRISDFVNRVNNSDDNAIVACAWAPQED